MKISLWNWLPFHEWRIVATVESADEIPDRLPRNGAVLVSDNNKLKWIAFDCPCRKGHRLVLNLDRARWPYWEIKKEKELTISPSIDFQNADQRCHFYIRNGRISWARWGADYDFK